MYNRLHMHLNDVCSVGIHIDVRSVGIHITIYSIHQPSLYAGAYYLKDAQAADYASTHV